MKLLSLDQPITEFDSVKCLSKGHPVFLLAASDGSHLVVKNETTRDATEAANLRRNLTVMSVASKQARSVILNTGEVQVLIQYCATQQMISRQFRAIESDDVIDFRKYLAQGGSWFKMNQAAGFVSLDSVAKQLLDGDKTGVRAVAKALNDSGGFEALGKIVAADMFNNNTDRFAPGLGGNAFVQTVTQGEVKFTTQVLVNIGNMMAAMSGGKLKAIGLDSWDPSTTLDSDFTQPATNQWTGHILAPMKKAQRLQFAQAICDDLNLFLGNRNRKFSWLQQKRLNANGPKRIVDGMEKFIKKMILILEFTLKKPNPPGGLASRLTILRGK